MPWVRAKVRGSSVFARVDEAGKLVADGGRVEVRYQPRDGRLYRAMAANVQIVDATVLPEDTCAPAEEVKRDVAKPAAHSTGKTAGSTGKAAGSQGKAAGSQGKAAGSQGKAAGSQGKAAGSQGKAAGSENLPTAPAPGTALAYSDGACSGNPGPAGLGLVVVTERERIELSEYLGQATNNVAELTAVLRALEAIEPSLPVVIYTDSRYAIGVIQQGWKAKANTELVAELRRRVVGRSVELRYVPGHAGVELNERADTLARQAIARRASERRASARSSG